MSGIYNKLKRNLVLSSFSYMFFLGLEKTLYFCGNSRMF